MKTSECGERLQIVCGDGTVTSSDIKIAVASINIPP